MNPHSHRLRISALNSALMCETIGLVSLMVKPIKNRWSVLTAMKKKLSSALIFRGLKIALLRTISRKTLNKSTTTLLLIQIPEALESPKGQNFQQLQVNCLQFCRQDTVLFVTSDKAGHRVSKVAIPCLWSRIKTAILSMMPLAR